MIESSGFDESLAELETLLRSAGNYVQPSDDLRPRILEASRCQQQERKVRHRLRWGVACIVFFSAVVPADREERSVDLASQLQELAESDADAVLVTERSDDSLDWRTVESFTALRQRQAEQLRSL